jgi:hypothetical protein
MARKLKGEAIQANTITVTQMNSNTWSEVYLALATANAAYGQANTANTAAASASGGFAKSFLTGI